MTANPWLLCFQGILWREFLRFLHQRGRFFAALVRPLVWLFIFAAGFRSVLGVSYQPPYVTYILYEVYITPGLCRHDPAVQRHAELAVDGLRPRDGLDARAAGQPDAALVAALLQARGRRPGRLLPGLCVPRHRLVLGCPAAGDRLPHRVPGPDDRRADAGRLGPAAVVDDPPARELRRRHELRHLPDVLRKLRALSRCGG